MAAPATDPPRKLPSMSDQQQQNLADVLPSEDPLDATDFDPVAYLNVLFPNERSLPSLEPRIEDAAEQVSQLDLEISKAVHAQAEAGARATKDIATAREAMAELCTRVASIKTKASESENLVREICADIKDLDNLIKASEALNVPTKVGVCQSKDSFFGEVEPERMPVSEYLDMKWKAWQRGGVGASEMEAATLFTLSSIFLSLIHI